MKKPFLLLAIATTALMFSLASCASQNSATTEKSDTSKVVDTMTPPPAAPADTSKVSPAPRDTNTVPAPADTVKK